MLVIYFIAHSDWILQRSRADMVNYLKEYFNITSICPLGDNKSEINQTYQNFIDWQINNKKLLDIGGVFNLRKILKNIESNSLIHIFTIKSLFLFIFSTFFLKKKFVVIVSITGLGYLFGNSLLGNILRVLIKPFIKYKINKEVDTIIFQNKKNYSDFLRYSNYKNNVKIIEGSGLNTEAFKQKKEQVKKNKIIFVGRLMREKGIYEYLAIADGMKENKNISFHIAGKPDFGNKSSLNLKEFDELKNNPNINYLGEIDVQENLHDFDILIQPSYHEGFSRVLLESIYSGLFCIVNDIPGMNEIISKTKHGLLIKENNIDLYIDEINNYLNGKYTLNHEYAAQVIEENYSVKAISDKFKELYYEFI
tara:strand:+ start:1 stop:1095 length:1095 start_codon:yes stop_codon:yes gene_type:complete